MSQPISPLEVINKIADSKPPIVIDAFNELIVENWNGHQSKFTQDDVIGRIEMKQTLCSVFDHRWLWRFDGRPVVIFTRMLVCQRAGGGCPGAK